MAVQEKYRGVFPAFYACYDEEGNVSRERASKLASFYHSIGMKGLYVTGSSGECVFHTLEERKATLEAVMEAVGGKMTVIAHIAASATRDSIALAQHAEKIGVDAIAMVPGFYYGLSEKVVYKYWTDVLHATDAVPMFIYNIPGTTNGFNLPTDLFLKMLETGRVAGVKNSSGSVQDIMRFRMFGGEDVAIFNGPDEQYLAGRLMGASGGIGGTYGYMPELFMKLDDLITKGDTATAASLQKEITGLIYETKKASSLYAAAKGVLRLRGLECGSVRAPFIPLCAEDEPIIRNLYEKIRETESRY
ncbi:MAG: dihydrodipicolinate synthase family protein [Clostridia bacterium]|nr:dihydrodipicolinate synthase family protein [Clostridia bacterium]